MMSDSAICSEILTRTLFYSVARAQPWMREYSKSAQHSLSKSTPKRSDGTPIDIKPVTESQTGHGFGELIVRELTATKFQSPPTESKWYYEVHRFHGLP